MDTSLYRDSRVQLIAASLIGVLLGYYSVNGSVLATIAYVAFGLIFWYLTLNGSNRSSKSAASYALLAIAVLGWWVFAAMLCAHALYSRDGGKSFSATLQEVGQFLARGEL